MKLRALRELFERFTGKEPKKLSEAEKKEIQEMADELFGTDAEIAAIGRTDIPPLDPMSINPPTRGGMMARQVLAKNNLLSPRRESPGGITSILNPRTDAEDMRVGKLGIGMGAAAGAGVYDATEGFTEPYNPANSILFNPEEIGRAAARAKKSIDEAFSDARQAVGDASQAPQLYFMRVQQGYNEEMQRQQEMQNIQEFGTPEEPVFIPESGEIKPVSLLFAEGGPAMSDNGLDRDWETRIK